MKFFWRHESATQKSPRLHTPSSLLQYSDQYYEDYIITQSDPACPYSFSPYPVTIGLHHCDPNFHFINRITSRYSIHYILSGKAWIGDQHVESGDIVFYGENQIQNFSTDYNDPCCYAWITFRGEESHNLLKSLGIPLKNMIYHTDNLTEICKHFYDLMYTDYGPHAVDLWIASHVFRILSLSAPNQNERSIQDEKITKKITEHYVNRSLLYIKENYSKPNFCTENIATAIGLNASYFRTLFKKTLGMSPMQYLNLYRIQAAQTLLNASNYTIKTIAMMVGFNNYQRFFDLFRKHTGISPSEYKKQKK